MNIRICSQCGKEYPETKEYFYKHKYSRGGLKAECKKCSYNYSLLRKEKDLDSFKAIKKKSTEKRKEKAAQYQKEHKDIVYAAVRRWKNKNPDKLRLYRHKRRALESNIQTFFDEIEWNKCIKSFNNKCAYCGLEKLLTQDHFIPLSKGGEYTINNIIPACLSCNASKQDKDFFDWYNKKSYYSKTREKQILNYLHYNKNNNQQLALF